MSSVQLSVGGCIQQRRAGARGDCARDWQLRINTSMLSATAPNLLYVLGIPGGSLLVAVLICYGIYRALARFEH